MKKNLFALLSTLSVCSVALAGNPLKVISGDKKFFKTNQGGAVLEILYDGASFDGKKPLTEKYSDIPEKTKISYDGFVEEFMENSKNINIVDKQSEAKYKITIKVTKVDEFVNIMGFIPGPCIRVWGTVTITDINGRNSLLTVNINEIDGGSAPTTDRAFNDTFGELGKRLSKLK